MPACVIEMEVAGVVSLAPEQLQAKRDNRPLNPNRPSLAGDNSMRQYKSRMTQQQCTRHKASSTDQGSAAGPPCCRAHNDAYRCQQSEEDQVKYLHGSREGLLQLSGVAAR
jgi:hypothetical protein